MNKLLTLLAIILCSYVFSQVQYSTDSVTISQNKPTDWELYIYNEDFKIEYKFVDCDPDMGYDFETVILRITNETNQKLEFSWHIDIYREGTCRTCDYEDEYRRTIVVAGDEVIEGDCVRNSNIELKVFSQFNDVLYSKGAKLTGFQLSDLSKEIL
jgi:hypothetical protein